VTFEEVDAFGQRGSVAIDEDEDVFDTDAGLVYVV
jgi:hypothetical protein